MLGIGVSLKPITYRDIVGDTAEWQEQHAEKLEKLRKRFARAARFRTSYPRRTPARPVLAPRRPEDVTLPKGYRHPPRISAEELRLGYLRHIPPEARVWA